MKTFTKLLLLPLLFLSFSLLAQEETAPVKPVPDEVFQVVEVMPLFPGCENINDKAAKKECAIEKMYAFVYEHLQYPKIAKDNGVEGTIVIRFVVDKDGSIMNPKIVRDVGAQCGKEGLRIVKMMPKWNPGKQRGMPVKVYYNLPIKFKLDGSISTVAKKTSPIAPENTPSAETEKEPRFKVVEQMPMFPGCENTGDIDAERECAMKKMLEFIYRNVKYPKIARENGVEGVVVIQYVIDKDGSIINPKIVREIGGGCGEEALRVVRMMPKWIPGVQRGETVKVDFNLPIKFSLEKRTKKKRKK